MEFENNKWTLAKNFEEASIFIDRLGNPDRTRLGFSVGTYTNLHFYLSNWFLFRIEFVAFNAIKIDYRRRKVPNRIIKSVEFHEVLKEVVKISDSRNHVAFYQDTIIINPSNKGYLNLVDQAIDLFYAEFGSDNKVNQVSIEVDVENRKDENSTAVIIADTPNERRQIDFNLRAISGINDSYYNINREERNLCAILFHTLLTGNNRTTFLKKINCDFQIVESEYSIYLEYAFIRDIWDKIRAVYGISGGNIKKRRIILDFINSEQKQELESLPIKSFNNLFIQSQIRSASSDEIESPGNWNVAQLDKLTDDNTEFLRLCKFKWSFNAKPDIVIHTSNHQAICIEGKLESGEGYYPSNKIEKDIFKRRNMPMVGQLSVQNTIMELLNIEAKFVLLSNHSLYSITHEQYSWKSIFTVLDTSTCPKFINEWIRRSDLN